MDGWRWVGVTGKAIVGSAQPEKTQQQKRQKSNQRWIGWLAVGAKETSPVVGAMQGVGMQACRHEEMDGGRANQGDKKRRAKWEHLFPGDPGHGGQETSAWPCASTRYLIIKMEAPVARCPMQ